jgi:hypothetical protein
MKKLLGLMLIATPAFAQVAIPVSAQVPIVIAYKDGVPQAALALDIAGDLASCQKALQEFLSQMEPKPGIVLSAGCMDVPPPPPLETKK